jgi:hypothetical protein
LTIAIPFGVKVFSNGKKRLGPMKCLFRAISIDIKAVAIHKRKDGRERVEASHSIVLGLLLLSASAHHPLSSLRMVRYFERASARGTYQNPWIPVAYGYL